MNRLCFSFLILIGLCFDGLFLNGQVAPRPPAIPLVACDPYFSVWSQYDQLNAGPSTHWTGKPHRLESTIRIDGQEFSLLGDAGTGNLLPQTRIDVAPTQTQATFEGQGLRVVLTFLTPALPDDVDLLSWPVTYVSWEVCAVDGKLHKVDVSISASGEIATNLPDQEVLAELVPNDSNLTLLRVGSVEQAVLAKSGDDLRIDWGYLYLASDQLGAQSSIQHSEKSKAAGETSIQLRLTLPNIGSEPKEVHAILAYDDLFSIQYMRQNLRPYWSRNGCTAIQLIGQAADQFDALRDRCQRFDQELIADLERAGGPAYARLGSLAYRQCFAAGKFVADANGQPLQFCKENHSNGCIATSDVFYPMAPQFLLFGPTLTKSFLVPFMNYAADSRWKFPFAPHDLGTYPLANGQRYGGGERSEENQMPVEESGNLLILFCAVAEMEGHADFAGLYWPQLTRWADYLGNKGFDPENQLCTDDFAGHLAHNVNLSAKAICGLGAYARMCELRGEKQVADQYWKLAREFATRWIKEADDGDHFRLAFDRPGTWSQKYNLVWDKLLNLNLFPDSVRRKEMDFYLRMQNDYGLPLDNRKEYSKLDWVLWTATLTQKRRDFEALLEPVDRFIHETPDRSPLTDWYETKTARKVGFTARPVIGGVFLQLLYDRQVWRKYASRDATRAKGWASLPQPPVFDHVVPAADKKPVEWKYTLQVPGEEWFREGFDDSTWSLGEGGFGTSGTPGSVIHTEWKTKDIWLRRRFELPTDLNFSELQLWIHHDEAAEVYINGTLAATLRGYSLEYRDIPLPATTLKALRVGENTLSIHCHQTTGGQYIDAGLVKQLPAASDRSK